MSDKFLKSHNAYREKDTKKLYVFLNEQKVYLGSNEYQRNEKIYPIKDGHFHLENPFIRKQEFDIHQILSRFSTIKDQLPVIEIKKKGKRPIVNPFTGGSVAKNLKNKSYKLLDYLYKEVNGKLVPRDEPTHLSYIDKSGNKRVTLRNSKTAKKYLEDNEYQLYEQVIVKKSEVQVLERQLFDGTVREFRIRPPVPDFQMHPSNRKAIIDLLREHLIPRLNNGDQINITAILSCDNGGQFKYHETRQFLRYTYDGDLAELILKIADEIAKYENQIFPSEDYTANLSRFNVLLLPPQSSGGCLEDSKDRLRFNDPDDPSTKLCSYPVKKGSNNCLIAILKRTSPVYKGSRIGFDTIRDKLGIERGRMIDIKEIETREMPDHFKLTIVVEWNGNVNTFGGDHPTKVFIKLKNSHYFHVLTEKTRQVNRAECRSSHRVNRSDEIDDSVYQPRGTHIMREEIDQKLVVCVDIDKWERKSRLTWNHLNKIYHGKMIDLMEFLIDLRSNLRDEDKYQTVYPKKQLDKKIIVHTFGGSVSFYQQLRLYVDENFPQLVTRYFAKNELINILNIGKNIECIDLQTLFGVDFGTLLSESTIEKTDGGIVDQKKLFNNIQDDFFINFHVHINNFISIPSLAEEVWRSTLRFNEGEEIYNLTDEQFQFVLQAKRGPRNYPVKATYQSSYYDQIVNAEDDQERKKICEQAEKEDDYMFVMDAMNFYPSLMTKYPYPAGKCRWMKNDELQSSLETIKQGGRLDKLGYYHVSYIPPSNLRTPVLLKHNANRNLVYDLFPGNDVYTNVEINVALDHGYQVVHLEKALVWDKSCDTYFSDYMKKIFNMKNSQSKIRVRISKLLMNSLYGRMLYRTNFNKRMLITSKEQLQNYYNENVITNFEVLSEDALRVCGYSKTHPLKYGSPVHLGCFVISYAKAYMIDFIDALDPTLKSSCFYYTDNDSLFIEAKYLKNLTEKNLLVVDGEKNAVNQMGRGKNDIKDGKLVIKAKFVKPKTYYYTYVSYDGEIKNIIKSAGVPRSFVNQNKKLIIKDYFDQMGQISFVNKAGEKTYSASLWKGMNFNPDKGEWFPYGYSK